MAELPFEKVSLRDPRIETIIGMELVHAKRTLAFCKGHYRQRELLIIVRKSNPLSLRYHGVPNYFPKPVTIKAKISKTTGWSYAVDDDDKEIPGPRFISDYDLHGVYERRHTGNYDRLYVSNYIDYTSKTTGTVTRIGSLTQASIPNNPFLRELNGYVCSAGRGRNMFQHGTEDDFRVAGRSGHRVFDSKTTLDDRGAIADLHIVFDHANKFDRKDRREDFVYILSPSQLQEYYRSKQLSFLWPVQR